MDLDIHYPERCPYPFKILPMTSMEGTEDRVFHDGFALVMRAEYQDLVGGERLVKGKGKNCQKKKVKPFPFKARVVGDKEIHVTAPLLTWSDRGNDDNLMRLNFSEPKYSGVLEALDVSRNAYIQRFGVDTYEAKEKIYVLRLMETSNTLIKLDGAVLLCNKKAKKNQIQDPGLLTPLAMSLCVDITSISDDSFNFIDVPSEDDPNQVTRFSLWNTTHVPRLVWQVANVAKKARRIGDIEEDVDDDDDDDDDIVKQMKRVGLGKNRP
jgi:hypothetical protein